MHPALSSDALARAIAALTGGDYLYFYDAISPIVEGESIDLDRVFAASRYGHGEADYLNCPMDRETYETFWRELTRAEEVPPPRLRGDQMLRGMPPDRGDRPAGIDTLAYGPMKPVGLIDPRTGG